MGQEPHLGAINLSGPFVADGLDLCDTDVTKLLVLHPEMPVADLLRITQEIAGDEATVTHSSSLFIEVAAAGVTKAMALAAFSSHLGLEPCHVLACGDMPNDLPMLRWAGYSVAVANAHPDVRSIVDEVTSTNNEDGVAHVLERLLSRMPPRLL